MSKTLDVYLYRHLVGCLIQDEHGLMVFDYAENWLENPNAIPLSCSLPLRKERFSFKECRGFFTGVLPEESKREVIARIFGISARNDFAMLEQIGGECAGAVTFIPTGQLLPERDEHYREVSNQELAEVLRTLPTRPLLAGEEGVRLSLAGAQDKIAVRMDGDRISIPLGDSPSTHILKPDIERFQGVVFNEALCMQLAASIGLPTANVQTRSVEGIDYLLIERYDRVVHMTSDGQAKLQRLHQEDFCQALGIPSEMKYQSEGGPSLKQCFSLLREVSSAPVIDLQHLLDAVIFNLLIGNHDAHAKNFSFLYGDGTSVERGTRLAPLYDLISTVYYPELSKKMAMKIGGEYAADKIFPRHFERLAEEAALAKPMVKKRIPEVAESLIHSLSSLTTEESVAKGVTQTIQKQAELVLERFR